MADGCTKFIDDSGMLMRKDKDLLHFVTRQLGYKGLLGIAPMTQDELMTPKQKEEL